jgi:hypothetical protein
MMGGRFAEFSVTEARAVNAAMDARNKSAPRV